ncbi:MAG: glycine betaine/L-proline ABC transporter ATP-binding protein, partial [Burkholderia sp.]|nr:glycine betaine/L-proline ABC transporter ATP-binding protein [Burkholderia sp.]
RPIREAFLPDFNAVSIDTDLHRLASIALTQQHDVPVTDATGQLAGVVSCRTILKQMMQRRAA